MSTTAGVADVDVESTGGRLAAARSSSVVLVLTVGLSFLLRFALAGKESYWLDELYSVYLYASQPASLAAAVSSLAETSIHPPLYQGLLYLWVALFGDTEAATRTLSNLAVTLAVVGLHRTTRRLHGARTADAAAVLFALSYVVTYYGLEARSYGLTLGLSVASTYLLVRAFEPVLGTAADGTRGSPRRATSTDRSFLPLATSWLVALSVANLLFLLTHYYNLFFWGTQAAFAVVAAATLAPRGRRVREAGRVTAIYLAQLVAFALLWGRVTLASLARFEGRYEVEEAVTATPPTMLSELVTPSFRFGPVPSALVAAVALLALVVSVALAARRPAVDAAAAQTVDHRSGSAHGFGVAYVATTTLGPVLLAYLAFLVLQQERFYDRYLIYVLPSVTLALLLAAREVVAAGRSWVPARYAEAVRLPGPAVLAGILLLPTVLPGFVDAATYEKVDWRGVTADVAAVTASNPDARYFVYETASRTTPVLDHYLERLGSDTRVDETLRRTDEDRGFFAFETEDRLATNDYLIVVFTHHRPHHYPQTLQRLAAAFPVHHRQLDAEGQGYIIFEVASG